MYTILYIALCIMYHVLRIILCIILRIMCIICIIYYSLYSLLYILYILFKTHGPAYILYKIIYIYIYFKTKSIVRPLKTPKKLQEDPRSLPSAAGHSRAGGASLSPLQICII